MSDNRIAELQGSVFAMIGLQFWQILNGIKWENVATGVITSILSAVSGYLIIKLVKFIERKITNGTR
jgi:hypothetical protein